MSHLSQAIHGIKHRIVAIQMDMSNSMMKEAILSFLNPRPWLASFGEQRMTFYQPWGLWLVVKQAVQAI